MEDKHSLWCVLGAKERKYFLRAAGSKTIPSTSKKKLKSIHWCQALKFANGILIRELHRRGWGAYLRQTGMAYIVSAGVEKAEAIEY